MKLFIKDNMVSEKTIQLCMELVEDISSNLDKGFSTVGVFIKKRSIQ